MRSLAPTGTMRVGFQPTSKNQKVYIPPAWRTTQFILNDDGETVSRPLLIKRSYKIDGALGVQRDIWFAPNDNVRNYCECFVVVFGLPPFSLKAGRGSSRML